MVDHYLQEIGKYELLDPEEEARLARTIREGNERESEEATQRLAAANLRFVVSVAKKYQGYGLSLSDLISEGNVGLLKAARRFDETRGFRFISYAVWWIRQAILESLSEHSRVVRLPANKGQAASTLYKTQAKLAQEKGRQPNLEELAKELDMDLEEVRDVLRHHGDELSLDAPLNEEDNNLLDVLSADGMDAPDQELLEDSLKVDIERALELLSEREAEVLRLYFGINREAAASLEEIGKHFGVTRERTRQIRDKALRKLRQKCYTKGLELRAV